MRTVKHGQLSYLQIPADDPQLSARFYERVFGWAIEREHASFESPGNVFGQWVADRPPAYDAGPVLWIAVDRIDEVLRQIAAAGGEVIGGPSADGSRRIATFRDPAGNVMGVVQEGGAR